MSISLNANFELLSAGLYLDARQQFNTIIEMKDFAETSIPDGFITYNKETQKHYVFSSSNTVDATLGKWREYDNGNSSSTTYATWNSNVDYKVGNVVLKDEVRYSCIADHTSTDFETDINNWIVILEQYYHVTQEQYNNMVSDGLITDSTKDLYIIDGNSEGGSSSSASYTTLEALGLTADASIDDVIGALKDGESFIGTTSLFTNYLTMFPNEEANYQYAVVRIERSTASRTIIEWYTKYGTAYAIGGMGDDNKFNGWKNIITENKLNNELDTKITVKSTSMVGMGFTLNNNYTTEEFIKGISGYLGTKKAMIIKIRWADDSRAYVNDIEINGGTLYCTQENDINTNTWVTLNILYIPRQSNKMYSFWATKDSANISCNVYTFSSGDTVDLTEVNTKIAQLENKTSTIPVMADNPTDYDLNNYKENGNYSIGDSTKYSNTPTVYPGLLTVIRSNSYRLQIYSVVTNNNVYYRYSTDWGATWKAWALLNDSTDLTDINTRLTQLENTIGGGTGGVGDVVIDNASISMGRKSGTTIGNYSTASGYNVEASAYTSHAEGYQTTASGEASHAEGMGSTASGLASHAEGYRTTASGEASHAEGMGSTASGDYSHAGGMNTIANAYQYAIGYANLNTTGGTSTDTTGSAFVIGNGTFYNGTVFRSNAFRVAFTGATYGAGAYNTSGADYAEYFEWIDGNVDNEDRRGLFVTLDGDKIKLANDGDYILGVVSSNPVVLGNSDMEWQGRFLKDKFGSLRIEKQIIKDVDEQGNEIEKEIEWYITNPEYDPNLEYVERKDRQEWTPVGFMGQLVVIDDGTCVVNGYCKCGVNGVATKADNGYRVMKRIDENTILVLIK